MKRGEAYWVYANGASDYPAPFSLAASTGGQVYFSPLTTRTTLTVANRTAEPQSLTFLSLSSLSSGIQIENPFASDPDQFHTGLHMHSEQLQPGQQKEITLYLDRTQTPAGLNDYLFTVSDQQGTLQYLSVTSDGGGLLGGSETNDILSLRGALAWHRIFERGWRSSCDQRHASHGRSGRRFRCGVIIFVDTNGAASLLREATLVTLPDFSTNIVDNERARWLCHEHHDYQRRTGFVESTGVDRAVSVPDIKTWRARRCAVLRQPNSTIVSTQLRFLSPARSLPMAH